MSSHQHKRAATGRLGTLLARPGAPLLVLRAFLGVTFCFAGLQKLANPNFFRRSAPGSFYAQLTGSIATSPLHHLLDLATHAPTLVAVLISAGEIAVGLGTLAGLFGRLAALGGMLLALTFFLTVSFNSNPYYYGPDIVFLFAWTPLALAGPGELSLDALLAGRAASEAPAARSNAQRETLARRVFLRRAAATAAVAGTGGLLGGLDALVGDHFAPVATAKRTIDTLPGAGSSATTTTGAAPTTTTPPSTTTPSPSTTNAAATTTTPTTSPPTTTTPAHTPKGTLVGNASDVPVGGAASFTDPAQNIPAYVVQPSSGHFVAFSAVCTHAGCTVSFQQSGTEFVCPCHGSVYNASTGAVISGPATSPLPSIPVALSEGQLYVDG